MYSIFLLSLIAAMLIGFGQRNIAIIMAFATTLLLAGLLSHHMTSKLPISL